jgi:hypothetical protein
MSNFFKVTYVLTSNGMDNYAKMTIASMLSIRHTNPSLDIILLMDVLTKESLTSEISFFYDVCNEVHSIVTPDGNSIFRNRWIKTQLVNYVNSSTLYLDSDTLVRSCVNNIGSDVTDIGFVPNHNMRCQKKQLWVSDIEDMDHMNWHRTLNFYPNGGVFFFHTTPAVTKFFENWHLNWLACYSRLKKGRDQPALYESLRTSDIELTELQKNYNLQVVLGTEPIHEGKIIHIYANPTSLKYPLGKILLLLDFLTTIEVSKTIAALLKNLYEWPNNGRIGRFLKDRYGFKDFVVHWLAGQKMKSIRAFTRYFIVRVKFKYCIQTFER